MQTEGRLGRYRLIKRLAAGGMSDIFLGQVHGARGYERTVVVKTIRDDVVEEDELVQLLMHEARIASCLRHENIVELGEVGVLGGTHFLAMEFVFGRDIRRIWERCDERGERIPYRHIVTMLVDVLDALTHAHDEATFEGQPLRVVHRDVSPQNAIVGFDGSTKLLDFGLAKAAAEISRTRAGVLKGKYAYMAPERVAFEGEDHRSDLFSVGVVLWELLTQRRLFFRNNDYETVQAVTRCKIPFARALRSDIPWNLAWIAFWALRKSPRWRYQSAAAMKDALLRSDSRPRAEARNEMADWLAGLFSSELRVRENALSRARKNPTRFRQIRDAGFELLEETTDPDLVARPVRRRKPSEVASGPAGLPGIVAAAVGTWRWFIAMLVVAVLSCTALGVYFGARGLDAENYGYVYVFADVPDVSVKVGDTKVGRAPVQRVAVLPGIHRITGESTKGTRTVEVEIVPGQNRVVQLRFE